MGAMSAMGRTDTVHGLLPHQAQKSEVGPARDEN